MVQTPTRAGALLRRARQRAGLSQVELARRAGVAQSVISAYESGARQPSLATLERLMAATGFDLDVRMRDAGDQDRRMTAPLGRRLREHGQEVKRIAAAHNVSNIRVFGSVARGEETAGSDIDLLVDVPRGVGLLRLARLQKELENLLGARVDVVPAADLKPGVRREAEEDTVAL